MIYIFTQSIAYYYSPKKVFIRCKILEVELDEDFYTLFAVDYGMPFRIRKVINMYRIPETFMLYPSPIVKVSLDIVPASTTFNFEAFKQMLGPHFKWSEKAIESFRNIEEEYLVVDFEHTLKDVKHDDKMFGSLKLLNRDGLIMDLSKTLARMKLAIRSTDSKTFFTLYSKTDSMKPTVWTNVSDGFKLPNFAHDFDMAEKTRELWINPNGTKMDRVNQWLKDNETEVSSENGNDDTDEDITTEITRARVEESDEETPIKFRKREKDVTSISVPAGYQIASLFQNYPKFVENCDQQNAAGNYKLEQKDSDYEDDDILEWPDD